MATRNAAGPRTLMLGVAAIALLGAGYGLAKLTTKPAPPPEAAAAPEAAPTEVKVEASYLKAPTSPCRPSPPATSAAQSRARAASWPRPAARRC